MPVAGLRVLLLRCCVDTEKGLWCWRSCCQVCFFWGRLPIINQSSIRNGLFMYTIHVLQSTLVASRLFMLQLSTEAKKKSWNSSGWSIICRQFSRTHSPTSRVRLLWRCRREQFVAWLKMTEVTNPMNQTCSADVQRQRGCRGAI